MPYSSETAKIHPSIAALYKAALMLHDKQPADVARRLNVSPQRLQNWESRGISKQGALHAQQIYSVDALALMGGELRRTAAAEKTQVVDFEPSHAPRFNAKILAATHRALRELHEAMTGLPYNLEDDPEHFLQAYELRAKLSQVSAADLVQIFKAAGLGTNQGAADNGRSGDGVAGVPNEGTHKGAVAGKVQRKKG